MPGRPRQLPELLPESAFPYACSWITRRHYTASPSGTATASRRLMRNPQHPRPNERPSRGGGGRGGVHAGDKRSSAVPAAAEARGRRTSAQRLIEAGSRAAAAREITLRRPSLPPSLRGMRRHPGRATRCAPAPWGGWSAAWPSWSGWPARELALTHISGDSCWARCQRRAARAAMRGSQQRHPQRRPQHRRCRARLESSRHGAASCSRVAP